MVAKNIKAVCKNIKYKDLIFDNEGKVYTYIDCVHSNLEMGKVYEFKYSELIISTSYTPEGVEIPTDTIIEYDINITDIGGAYYPSKGYVFYNKSSKEYSLFNHFFTPLRKHNLTELLND
jgi:hypothetical protein